MSLFDEAKHKIEEVVGKVEQTLGGAFGNTAMEVSGEAHAEHGEALLEEDEARHMQKADDQQPNDAGTPNVDVPEAQSDEALMQQREQEQRMSDVQRKIDEAKHAQNTAADAGEPMRRADPAAATDSATETDPATDASAAERAD